MSQNHSEEEEGIDEILEGILSVPSTVASRFERTDGSNKGVRLLYGMTSKRRIKFVDQIVSGTVTSIGSLFIPVIVIAGTPGTSDSQAAMCISGQSKEGDDPEQHVEEAISCLESFLSTILQLYFKTGGKLSSAFEILHRVADEREEKNG